MPHLPWPLLRHLLHTWLRRGLAAAVVVGLAVCVGRGLAAESPRQDATLVLADGQALFDAWPAVRVLADPAGTVDLAGALARRAEFLRPTGPASNLGPRRQVTWLHLPLQVAGGDGRWVLDINYPPLEEVQLHLLQHGRVVAQHRLGSAQPYVQRPMPTRSHAVTLELAAGQTYELLLRVQTNSAMLLPITLSKTAHFIAREAQTQLSQGLILGVALTLLVYSLAHGISLRDSLFGLYAALLVGSTVFFLDFFGIGQQLLWSQRQGLTAMLSPLSVLLAAAAGGQFVMRSLDTRRHSPWLHRGLVLLSALSAALLVLGLLGGLSYRSAQLLATAVGPVVPLLAIPAAWRRARAGDRVGLSMLIGWSAYVVGAFSAALLLRGQLPVTYWTLHSYQWCTLVEMLAWLRVLGLHIEGVRLQAERSAAEKRSFEALALTDALTGLPNRRGMQAALDAALAQAAPGRGLAVFMLDLDGFKAVNDRLGHEAGDSLLVQVSQRLKQPLRRSDVVARLGGDEFVVLAQGVAQPDEAQAIGRKLLAACDAPFQVNGQDCRVGLTIGFALAPEDGLDAGALLRQADAAMYAGKQAGRHQLRRAGAAVALA